MPAKAGIHGRQLGTANCFSTDALQLVIYASVKREFGVGA